MLQEIYRVIAVMTATRKTYWEENGSHTKTQAFANRNPRSDFSVPY
jgi:hypothetical protein